GFFLDQQWNCQLLLQLLRRGWPTEAPFRVMDLCTYVGQWSTQVAGLAKSLEKDVSIDLVDVSEPALKLAQANVANYGGTAQIHVVDVMEEWPEQLAEKSYDVVILDPPAFVKKKTDLAKGLSAYTRLNRE